jgi:eukaryotic-like serine/threonine-protein kinase
VKEASQTRYLARFDPFEVNLRTGELLRRGEPIKLHEQSFQILTLLLERPGDVIMRQEIQKRLWPNDTVVEFENSINAAIKKLRLALGDSADQPRYVETLARRGYRWKAPVEWVDPSPAQPQSSAALAESSERSFASHLIGRTVSHYLVLEILGGGGMGLVYKAEDVKLGRCVALKFLPEELVGGATALQRFEREARAASTLNDPNICTIHGIEEHEGQPFIVMELLEGQTLRELISSNSPTRQSRPAGALPFQQLLDISIQIASGLGAAHRKGIIHRDIKPANIFLTTSGHVKILDFGLAKLMHTDAEGSEVQSIDGRHAKPPWNPHLTLTRTGATIGTAGYMSPEQIQGGKLDARADIFSFGLVLYEMASGQQAFTGETAPVLENAILHNEPARVRELNRDIPPKFETIIKKALEKDREKRYQTVSEMRADLEHVKRDTAPRNRLRRWTYAAAAIAVLLIGAAVLSFLRAPRSSQGLPEIKIQQLTENSAENPVAGGNISPDGKYLAYIDTKGIHIKLIGSDEIQNVPQPEGIESGSVVWEIGFDHAAWFPDSRRFFVHTHPATEAPNQWSALTTSIWVVSILGGPPRKLREQAMAWDVSPDGSWIAFTTNFVRGAGYEGEKEMWLMAPDGTQAHKLFESEPHTVICCLHFFAEQHRVGYIVNNSSGDRFVTRDVNGGPVTTLFTPDETKNRGDGTWLPGGNFLYTDNCGPVGIRADASCNFWINRVDVRTGKVIEAPRRLTNWFGFSIADPSATADGKRVAFLEAYARGATVVADVEMGGTRLTNSRRVTIEEGGDDLVRDWTADGKTLIIDHLRGDRYRISKQPLNGDTPESVVTGGAGLAERAIASPDGKWIILQVFPLKPDPVLLRTPVPVMRVPMTGGTPETIFTVREGGSTMCARPPSNLCVAAETTEDLKAVIVTAFDPAKGRGSVLARFPLGDDAGLGSDHLLLYDLSPDGSRLAFARSPQGPIEIHSLQGQEPVTIPTTGLDPLRHIIWTADGKGLFVSTHKQDSGELLHLNLRGKANLVWKCTGPWMCMANPSPDGRHLAIYEAKHNANIFMMENF